jgi:predicted Zn-dependent protease
MGQIALSLGDIPRAAGYLQEAHRLNPQNRVSAQLLGEVRALQGDADAAAALWLPLDLGQNQLDTRLNWYRSLALAEEVARMEAAVIVYTQSYQEKAAQ